MKSREVTFLELSWEGGFPYSKGLGAKKLSFENTFDRVTDFASLRPALSSGKREDRRAQQNLAFRPPLKSKLKALTNNSLVLLL